MVNEPLPVFPAASVAVQFTVVVPMWKRLPDGGLHDTFDIGSSPVAVTPRYVTKAPSKLVGKTVIGRGTVMTGGDVTADAKCGIEEAMLTSKIAATRPAEIRQECSIILF